MSLKSGTRIDAYEILAAVGAGGMGEVYRAHDVKLGRDVAIKVLPEAFASDADRLARFEREAKTLAALNHPNIAQIYGLSEMENGGRALVMEFVEGDDLSQRIARGPVPVADAVPIARQIVEALETAHEQGIVHRDLKPANIRVRADGTVKVLDFGLAKAMESTAALSAMASNAPTLTSPAMTMAGVVLGTAAYTSPEQARGRAADKRSDIWSFGVVVYEMLTGRRAFDGDEMSDVLASVLRQDVDWSALPPETPLALRQLLRRCLERDPRQRLRDIGEARIAIDAAAREPDAAVSVVAPVISRTRERLAWAAAGFFALVAAGALAWTLRPAAALSETRLDIVTPATDDMASVAISPDGRQIVFVGSTTNGPSQLWLRPLNETTARPLAGTDGATVPFWSPDGRSVAFFTESTLKRLDIENGLIKTLASLGSGPRGGSWNADDVILFGSASRPLIRVSAAEGAPADATKLEPGQTAHRFPHFLPGGRQFLFFAAGVSTGLFLGSLDSPEVTRLADSDSGAMFVQPGWLLFVRQGTLLAQRFDVARGALTGEPISVADRVSYNQMSSAAAFAVSPTGTIAYRTGRAAVTQFTWFDRSGTAAGTVGPLDGNRLMQPMLSPDGRRVVAWGTTRNNTDVWLLDVARMTPLTFDATSEMYPIWSPDGVRIAFSKTPSAKGLQDLYQKSTSGAGQEELILAATQTGVAPQSWSPDGRFLIYIARHPETAGDLWVLPLDGKQAPYPFLNSKFEDRMAQFSPDGRWVAYASTQSGRQEIYVRPFSNAGGQWEVPVSTSGGVTPRWRRDGKELYYIAPDGKLMAVSVSTTGAAPEVGTPAVLFQTRILFGGTSPVGTSWQYDVAPDGRFLINVTVGDAVTPPITVIQNWTPKS